MENYDVFREIRKNIAANKLPKAFTLIYNIIDTRRVSIAFCRANKLPDNSLRDLLNDVILLENQYRNCLEINFFLPKKNDHERNRIIYGLLMLVSEIENRLIVDSTSIHRARALIENELYKSYSQIKKLTIKGEEKPPEDVEYTENLERRILLLERSYKKVNFILKIGATGVFGSLFVFYLIKKYLESLDSEQDTYQIEEPLIAFTHSTILDLGAIDQSQTEIFFLEGDEDIADITFGEHDAHSFTSHSRYRLDDDDDGDDGDDD